MMMRSGRDSTPKPNRDGKNPTRERSVKPKKPSKPPKGPVPTPLPKKDQ